MKGSKAKTPSLHALALPTRTAAIPAGSVAGRAAMSHG
jgi:hypothetical protein